MIKRRVKEETMKNKQSIEKKGKKNCGPQPTTKLLMVLPPDGLLA